MAIGFQGGLLHKQDNAIELIATNLGYERANQPKKAEIAYETKFSQYNSIRVVRMA